MNRDMWSFQFWKTTIELAVRGSAIGFITATGGSAIDVWHLQWKVIGGMVLSTALLSVAASLSSISVGDKGSPLVTASPNESEHST